MVYTIAKIAKLGPIGNCITWI